MEFVQRQVFTNDGFSRGIMEVLGANGVKQVRKAFDGSASKDQLIALFNRIIDEEFVDLDTFEGYSSNNKISFMPIHRALRQIDFFKKDAPASDEVKYRKLYMLLESLEFVEADIYLRILTKRFDVKSVESVLYPDREAAKTPRKSRKSTQMDQGDLNETDNNDSITDLRKDSE